MYCTAPPMADGGGGEHGRKASGGSSPGSGKMRAKVKLTIDPSLTPAVTEPKPNFALYASPCCGNSSRWRRDLSRPCRCYLSCLSKLSICLVCQNHAIRLSLTKHDNFASITYHCSSNAGTFSEEDVKISQKVSFAKTPCRGF